MVVGFSASPCPRHVAKKPRFRIFFFERPTTKTRRRVNETFGKQVHQAARPRRVRCDLPLGGTGNDNEAGNEYGTDGGIEFDYLETDSEITEINNGAYTSTETETGYEEEDGQRENFDDTYVESGVVYEDGHLVILSEEALPDDFTDEDLYSYEGYIYFGYRITEDVILNGIGFAEDATAAAYRKID
jgi:hypothetical protein